MSERQEPAVPRALGSHAVERRARAALTKVGLVDALCLAATNPAQALEFACSTSALWSTWPASFSRERGLLRVSSMSAACPPAELEAAAFERVQLWLRLVENTSAISIQPCVLYLPALSEARERELRHRFECVIHFGQSEVAVFFRGSDLAQPNPHADPGLVQILNRCAEERLALLTGARAMTDQLWRLLRNLASVRQACAETSAQSLGISVRTLHRRLRAESTSYRRVLEDYRLQRCCEQLQSSSLSAKQIAIELGFSSPASFHRAFKRWTGHTVGEYRRQQRGPSA